MNIIYRFQYSNNKIAGRNQVFHNIENFVPNHQYTYFTVHKTLRVLMMLNSNSLSLSFLHLYVYNNFTYSGWSMIILSWDMGSTKFELKNNIIQFCSILLVRVEPGIYVANMLIIKQRPANRSLIFSGILLTPIFWELIFENIFILYVIFYGTYIYEMKNLSELIDTNIIVIRTKFHLGIEFKISYIILNQLLFVWYVLVLFQI